MKSNFFTDIGNVLQHTLRLLLKSKETGVIFAFSFLILFSMLYFMEDEKEEKSVIYIGMADEDQSVLSHKLLLKVKQNDLFSVSEGKISELLESLKARELSAVFLIKDGYEASVRNGYTRNLITLYEAKGKQLPLIGDILAGEMMLDLCTAKGFLEYKKEMEKTNRNALTQEKYSDYVMQELDCDSFDFSFSVTYLTMEGQNGKKPENTMIYQQLIFAMEALMLGVIAIYAVMPYYHLCHGRVLKRNALLPISPLTWTIGSAIASMVVELLFGTSFLVIFIIKNHETSVEFLSMFLCTVGFCGGIVLLTMLFAGCCNNFTIYQLGMLCIIVMFGIAGFMSIFEGLLWKQNWISLIPNYWYVQQMLKLI